MGKEIPGEVRFSGGVDWSPRRDGAANRTLIALDAVNAAIETPVAAATRAGGDEPRRDGKQLQSRNPLHSHSPLHHTGPIAVFLFVVAFVTGVYVTMFFRFGFELAEIGTRAGDTVPGLDAAAYLRQSILDPDAYVVRGFGAGQMLPGFATVLEEDEIDHLVAFLITLEDE